MPVVSADTLQLAAIAEATPGTTPPTPTFQLWRTTGESVTFTPETSDSGELGSSGRSQRPSNVVGMTVAGDINFELSKFPALDAAIAGVLAGKWGECPLTGAPGGAIDDSERVTVGDQLQTFTIEKRFNNPDVTEGAMDITGSAGAPGATVTITFANGPAVGSGVAMISITTDTGTTEMFEIPIAPGDTAVMVGAKATTILDAHAELSVTDNLDGTIDVAAAGDATSLTVNSVRTGADAYYFQRYRGCTYSVLNLSVTPNAPVTGNVSLVSGIPELDRLPLEGAVYTSAGSSSVFTAPEVLSISVGTILGIGTHCWSSLDISIDSQNRGIACIGTQGERETVLGQAAVSVAGDVFFTDDSVLEYLLNNQVIGDGDIAFSNADGDVYRFDLFDVKAVGGELTAGGTGEDLTIPLELQPTPVKVCDDGAGSDWEASVIVSTKNTAPTLP